MKLSWFSIFLTSYTCIGQVFVTDFNAGTIGKYSSSGSPINFSMVSGLVNPSGLALDTKGNLYVANYSSGSIGKYTIGGDVISNSLLAVTYGVEGMVVSEDEHLYTASYANGLVGKYTVNGATINGSLISGLFHAGGIAVEGSNLYVAVGGNGTNDTVRLYTTDGVLVKSNLITGLHWPGGIALDGQGNIYVKNWGNGTIGKYSISGIPINTNLISGLDNSFGIALDGNGYLFATKNRYISKYTTSGTFISEVRIPGLSYGFDVIAIPNKPPLLSDAKFSEGTFSFNWNSSYGKSYQVQYTSDIGSTNWSNIGIPIYTTNTVSSFSEDAAPDNLGFYRVVLLP